MGLRRALRHGTQTFSRGAICRGSAAVSDLSTGDDSGDAQGGDVVEGDTIGDKVM